MGTAHLKPRLGGLPGGVLGTVLAGWALAAAAAPPGPVRALPRWTEPRTGLVFLTLPAGCFSMGRSAALRPHVDFHWDFLRPGWRLNADETPEHEVCLDPFALAQTEVTAAQWRRVMGQWPPQGRGREPAQGVSKTQAEAFVKALSALSGERFELPSESQWEYACRAGQAQPEPDNAQVVPGAHYHHGWGTDTPERWAAAPVGQQSPNAWGFHDLLGNVWEWVRDGYKPHAYAEHPLYNPVVSDPGPQQGVLRGGSYRSSYLHIRCSARSALSPQHAAPGTGVRVMRVLGGA